MVSRFEQRCSDVIAMKKIPRANGRFRYGIVPPALGPASMTAPLNSASKSCTKQKDVWADIPAIFVNRNFVIATELDTERQG